jgi:hypothetical protein
MALMGDPIETFLGWQANRNDETVQVGQKRLFNENLINETINFMTQQLAKIRIAKQTGGDVKAAIAATNEEVLRAQAPTNTMGRVTNDPMLANMASEANSNVMNNNFQNVAVNPQEVVNRNTDPFSTPPAAHLDPVTASPVFGQSNSEFTKPAFMSNPSYGAQEDSSDLPF